MRYLIHDNVSPLANITRAGKTNYPDLIKTPEGHTLVEVSAGETDFAPHTHCFDLTTGLVVAKQIDPLPSLRNKKITGLTRACDNTIIGGFTSSASGIARTYPSKEPDQRNMMQAAHVGGALWCCEGSLWSIVPHTPEQAKQVLSDFVLMRDAARTKLVAKKTAIAIAATSDAVAAVIWT